MSKLSKLIGSITFSIPEITKIARQGTNLYIERSNNEDISEYISKLNEEYKGIFNIVDEYISEGATIIYDRKLCKLYTEQLVDFKSKFKNIRKIRISSLKPYYTGKDNFRLKIYIKKDDDSVSKIEDYILKLLVSNSINPNVEILNIRNYSNNDGLVTLHG